MFSKSLVCLAFAALASAQSLVLGFTSVPTPVTDGQPQAITYQTNDTVTPVTITLRRGVATALDTLYNITTTATGGSYIWTPRTDLPNGNDYALQISQGTQTNYYGPFRVQGYIGPLSSTSSSGSTSGSSTALSTTTGSQRSTITSVGPLSTGTGSSVPRNTTFSSATLSSTSTVVTTSTVSVSQTVASASATRTGAANANAQIGSSLALVGAIAALMLH